MNRVIKFRGKREDNGEFVFGLLMYFEDEYGIQSSHGCKIYEIVPETIGQFTGLYDKNGKEIYDSDIVLYVDKYRYIVQYGVWNHNPQNCAHSYILSWHLEWVDMPGVFENIYVINGVAARFPEHCGKYTEAIDNLKLKVIGNIHDNPELINNLK